MLNHWRSAREARRLAKERLSKASGTKAIKPIRGPRNEAAVRYRKPANAGKAWHFTGARHGQVY